MTKFTSTDWNRKSGDIFEAARRAPVTITQRARPAFVVLSYDHFQGLIKGETRKHFTLDTLPNELLHKAEAELDRMENEGGE